METQLNTTVRSPASRRQLLLGLAVSGAMASVQGHCLAANITLTASDTLTNNSFVTGTRWSNGQPPSPDNDYFVPSSLTLRTPGDTGSVAFAGNSLTIGDNGAALGVFLLKNLTGSTVTVNNLTFNKGTVQNGGTNAGGATTITLAGNGITVGAGGATFDNGGAGRVINVDSVIGGAGPVSVIGQGFVAFRAANTYTSTTTVSAGALYATDGFSLPSASPLALAGGALGTSGTFTRGLGTGGGQVTVTTTGGFTSVGGNLVVAIGGTETPTPLTVGVNGFNPALMPLNYSTATNLIDFRNSVDLAGTTTFGVLTNANLLTNAATFSGNLSDSVGGGVFTKFGTGLLTLTGTNTHSGRTAVNQGVLRATEGVSLPATTNLSFNGGVFSPADGVFTRGLGTGPGQVQWIPAGTGGFAAIGNDVTVSLGGVGTPTPLVWGVTDAFNPGVLTLGSRVDTNTVTFTNAVDLSTPTVGTTRNITSLGGTGVLTGVISNTGAAQGTLGIEGDGTAAGGVIVLASANTYGGTTLIDVGTVGSGTVRATNNQSFGTSLVQFNTGGNGTTARLELANNITVANNINLSGRNTNSDAIRNVSGNNTLGGTITVGTGGGQYIVQSDAGTLTLTGATGSTAGTAITSAATGGRNITLQGAANGVVSGVIANGSGTVQVAKLGTGTWTLSGSNTYTGPTAALGGTVAIPGISNGGTASPIGASTNAATNLVLAGGTLQYTGPAASTDRLFAVGVNGGTIDSSGSGPLAFNGGGANVAIDPATAGTTVSGSNTVTVTAGTAFGLVVGQTVSGTGIPAGATVTGVNPNGGTFTISANATAAGTGVALAIAGATPPRTLTLAGSNTGANAIATTLANSAAGNVVAVNKAGGGSWRLSGPNTYTGTTTVQAGTLTATAPAYANTVLGTGGLDVQGGRFVFDYTDAVSPLATVKSILTAGYAGGFTTGQIRSTARPAGTTIGYGETPNSTVTVRVTLPGDANLDGAVGFDDFVLLQGNFSQSNVTFAQGDFDYNGVVNFNDFVLLQGSFGQSLPGGRAAFTREEYAAVMSITDAGQVPEPASLALLGLSAAGLLRRRRGR